MSLEEARMGAVRDWRKALRTAPAHRIVNKTLRNQTQFLSIVTVLGIFVLIILYMFPRKSTSTSGTYSTSAYNYTYPLTAPIKTNNMHTFRIGIIADLDTNSKSKTKKDTWFSYLKKGYLSYSPTKHTVVVTWDHTKPVELTTSFALKDRGMELSELVVFDGRLLSFDDRTGLVFEIIDDKAYPWLLLMDGNGKTGKGFKSEWATVKDDVLFVGSMGKEWTTSSGEFQSNDPQYVKFVSTKGLVTHASWVEEYKRIREVLGIYWPGYMIHESGLWSITHRRWFFLPRRCSKESYNETLDERRGCSWLITANEHMRDVKATKISNSVTSRGFSSFKFVPGTNDEVVVALRTEELEGKTATYITAFRTDGVVLLEDTLVSDMKYEGLEFI